MKAPSPNRYSLVLAVPLALLLSLAPGELLGEISCSWYEEYDGVILGSSGTWDAYPSHLYVNGIHNIWWCGTSSIGGSLSTHVDAVFHSQKPSSLGPGGWSARSEVFNHQHVAWASNHVCDPSVANGSFNFGSSTYDYALYFTADTNDATAGVDNAIGVAFSNDGGTWTSNPTPVIEPDNGFNGSYGAGMSGVSWDGSFLVHTFFDSTNGNRIRLKESTDGIQFSPTPSQNTFISDSGRNPGDGQGPDIAYSPSEERWYAVIKTHSPNGTYDGETRVLRATQPNELLGTWEVIAIFNSADTGWALNHNPALAKNADGTLFRNSEGWGYVFISVGNELPDWPSWNIAQGRFRRLCNISSP